MPRLRARALALCLLWPAAARAQESVLSPEPQIEVTGCPDAPADTLRALIELEIDVLLRERGPTRAPPDHIAVRCSDERARIDVTMQDRVQSSSLDLVALAPEHRPRAIALAAAELVHSLSNRPAAAPPKAPATAPALRETAPLAEPRHTAWRRPTLSAGGLVTWLGQPAAILFGGRAAFQVPVTALLAPALSVEAATGGFHTDSAQISVTTLSAGAALGFGVTTGSVRWDAGPGARFGWVRLAGEPDAATSLEGDHLAGAWGGFEARARAAYGVSSNGSPLFALEVGAGLVTLPVRGLIDGTERVYAIDGPWLSISAEVGIAL
jgi:hypothetical protein